MTVTIASVTVARRLSVTRTWGVLQRRVRLTVPVTGTVGRLGLRSVTAWQKSAARPGFN